MAEILIKAFSVCAKIDMAHLCHVHKITARQE